MASVAETTNPSTEPARTEDLDPISKRLQSLQLASNERRGGGGRRWGRLFGLLALLGLGIGAFVGYEQYKKSQAAIIPETEAISFGERAGGGIILDVSGYIIPKTKIQISPQVAGKILSLPIEEGMHVKEGDTLCKIEDDTYQAEVDRNKGALALAEAGLLKLKNGAEPEEIEQAKAQLATAEASHKEAKDNLDRINRLRESGSASQSEVERAIAAFQTAEGNLISSRASLRLLERGARAEDIATQEAQVAQARAALRAAEINADNTIIRAPCDGTILEKNAQEGELILPQTVIKSLCVLADLSEMEAEVDIQERELARIQIGHPCQVVPDAYPDHIYKAELARMQPQVNRARGVVPVKVRIVDPKEHPDSPLLSEMNCRVLFLKREEESGPQTPTVPSRGVVTKDGASHVYVLEKDVARKRSVSIGKTLGDEIEISDGLKTGEIVLLPDKEPLADGQTIRVKLLETVEASQTP